MTTYARRLLRLFPAATLGLGLLAGILAPHAAAGGRVVDEPWGRSCSLAWCKPNAYAPATDGLGRALATKAAEAKAQAEATPAGLVCSARAGLDAKAVVIRYARTVDRHPVGSFDQVDLSTAISLATHGDAYLLSYCR